MAPRLGTGPKRAMTPKPSPEPLRGRVPGRVLGSKQGRGQRHARDRDRNRRADALCRGRADRYGVEMVRTLSRRCSCWPSRRGGTAAQPRANSVARAGCCKLTVRRTPACAAGERRRRVPPLRALTPLAPHASMAEQTEAKETTNGHPGTAAHRGGGLSGRAGGARHRPPVRQSRHRFRPDRRGLRPRRAHQPPGAARRWWCRTKTPRWRWRTATPWSPAGRRR